MMVRKPPVPKKKIWSKAFLTIPLLILCSFYSLVNQFSLNEIIYTECNNTFSTPARLNSTYLEPTIIYTYIYSRPNFRKEPFLIMMLQIMEYRSRFVFEVTENIEQADLIFLGTVRDPDSGEFYADTDFFALRDYKELSSKSLIVYWTGEKHHIPEYFYTRYNLIVDVAIGMRHDAGHRNAAYAYSRFPFGFQSFIDPKNCKLKTELLEKYQGEKAYLAWKERPINVSIFVGHLAFPREEMFNMSKRILGDVVSGGKALHNTAEPYPVVKGQYLLKSKFVICPENAHVPGYVTEKLYHAFLYGAIPLYWPIPNPEPSIINPNRLIFYNPNDPTVAEQKIKQLMEDDRAARSFFEEPIFMDSAQDYLYSMCDSFSTEIVSRLESLKGSVPSFDQSPYYCRHNLQNSKAQEGQDIFLFNTAFKGMCGGTFVEMGGADGISNSNTYGAEMDLGWKGILIEANPHAYELLSRRRERTNSIKIFGAVGDREANVTYIQIDGPQAQLSCVKEFASPNHLKRIERDMNRTGSKDIQFVSVPMKPLEKWAAMYELYHINWFCLDVEGAELTVLKMLDLSKLKVDFFQIEKNGNVEALLRHLEPYGYAVYKPWQEQMENNLDIVFCHKSICTEV